MSNERIPNDQPLRRDAEREPVHDHVDQPWWCPAGLTRSQKRRVQRLCQTELLEKKERKLSRRRESNRKSGASSQGPMIDKILGHWLHLLTWFSCYLASLWRQAVVKMN